ncbi:hypothetical protein BpHYR1_031911 [Brachionus plicatilis]|uniref:Uncharacterized protein n=1 Tax=Brachionus plicatilis TaxID=10195 RepID=A0A3M7RA60_BRAPC|nr:hypothetical protein BpHYR1_031911 [Brachionus plicatilis]
MYHSRLRSHMIDFLINIHFETYLMGKFIYWDIFYKSLLKGFVKFSTKEQSKFKINSVNAEWCNIQSCINYLRDVQRLISDRLLDVTMSQYYTVITSTHNIELDRLLEFGIIIVLPIEYCLEVF